MRAWITARRTGHGRAAEETTRSLVEEDVKLARRAHDAAEHPRCGILGIEPDVREPIENRIECARHLQPREYLAEAIVGAEGKAEVAMALTEDVERVGVLEDFGITIRRAVRNRDDRVRRDLDATYHGVTDSSARGADHRSLPPKRFLHGSLHEL